MKRLLPILLLSFIAIQTYAQDYACILPAEKQYYINGNNYLRGMRIDSIDVKGDTTVYYPFKTPRFNNSPKLDLKGGSWMGSKIIALKDGTYWFLNHWDDTIVIKSQAQLNDNWVMYQEDTSGIYYDAQVIAVDTMTVVGTVDSVKTLSITGYNKHGSIPAINGLTFLLSKRHGFVALHDIYFFPYHHPGDDSNFVHTIEDYYTYIIQAFTRFSLIDFKSPLRSEMFQYNVGDIFFTVDKPQSWNGIDNIYFYDSVTAINTIPNGKEYVVKRTTHSPVYPPPGPPPLIVTYDTVFSTYTIQADSTPFITEFPEESGNSYIYYYYPNDTSYCITSDLYRIDIDQIVGDIVHLTTDVTTSIQKYKVAIGRVYHDVYRVLQPRFLSFIRKLEYYRLGNADCGQYYFPLNASNITQEQAAISIYPNPASGNSVYINIDSDGVYSLKVYDVMGKQLDDRILYKQNIVDVSSYAAGVYQFVIEGINGSTHNEKVVIY